MDGFWGKFLLEIGLFTLLGGLYYFYQKRKIVHYEENKISIVMNMILQSCLADKTEEPQPELDALITSLDDFIQHQSASPPIALLKDFMHSSKASPELKDVIKACLLELDIINDKE